MYHDRSSKRSEWSKGTIKNIEEPGCKYTITKDNGMSVTQTRCDIRPDGLYVTQSGRISRPPDHLIQKCNTIVNSILCWKGKKLS